MIDVFCIASGPSLTAADCDLAKRSGAKIIAVNNSWQLAPFCDYLYAGDEKWWKAYHKEINVSAEKWTCSREAANTFGLNFHAIGGGYNSGLRAIQFAIFKGFKSIGLLGYDCSLANGVHWHGLHTKQFLKNPSAPKLARWHVQFAKVAEKLASAHVQVINLSRHTELTCFKRAALEDVLSVY